MSAAGGIKPAFQEALARGEEEEERFRPLGSWVKGLMNSNQEGLERERLL